LNPFKQLECGLLVSLLLTQFVPSTVNVVTIACSKYLEHLKKLRELIKSGNVLVANDSFNVKAACTKVADNQNNLMKEQK